jgi:hypothetical protein
MAGHISETASVRREGDDRFSFDWERAVGHKG